MNLVHITAFGVAALIYSWRCPPSARGWVLMLGSIVAVFSLISEAVLSTLTIGLTYLVWLSLREPGAPISEPDRKAVAATLITMIAMVVVQAVVTSEHP